MTASTALAALSPGFADPVAASQATFRAVLEAMSRPGRIVPVIDLPPAPVPLYPAAGAVVLTLADMDAPVSLDGRLDTPEVAAWLRFHTGCPLVPRERAAFALIGDAAGLDSLEPFAIGTVEFPDRSATLIVQVPALRAEGHRLRGPGIADVAHLGVDGLAPGFWTAWAANGALFPQGVDVIFATPTAVCALTRTTRVED